MQRLYVVFDALDQLSLVLADGAAYVRADEQGVETGEYAEHLVGVLSGAQLVA